MFSYRIFRFLNAGGGRPTENDQQAGRGEVLPGRALVPGNGSGGGILEPWEGEWGDNVLEPWEGEWGDKIFDLHGN